MIRFNDDGTTTIDFPDGPVTIRPPTFGALKRLRAERRTLARKAEDQIAVWDEANPEPEPSEEPSDAEIVAVARRAEDRQFAAEEANLAATVAWWRLILLGDDTFKKLADGPVPENPDDWPAALLFDVRPVIPPNSSLDVILSAQSVPDQWVRHVGNAHSRSGHTNGAGQPQTISQQSPAL